LSLLEISSSNRHGDCDVEKRFSRSAFRIRPFITKQERIDITLTMVLVNSPSLSERAKRFQERAIRTKTAGIKAKAKKVTKKTKKPAKTKPMNCTKTAGIKAKAKKVTTKTKKPAKTKPRNNPVVPVATKATNIMILPESLNPEDDVELLNFFEAFGVVASRKVSMVFLKPDGQKVEKKVKHHKNLRRMVAALIIHFL
jgi:hypothetical protein